MLTLATEALRILTNEMIEHGEFTANWQHIDRISARWPVLRSLPYSWLRQHKESMERAQRARDRQQWAGDNAFYVMPNPYDIHTA